MKLMEQFFNNEISDNDQPFYKSMIIDNCFDDPLIKSLEMHIATENIISQLRIKYPVQ